MSTLRRSAALAAALCAFAAHAGLTITTEMKKKGKTGALTMQFEGKNLRSEVTKDGSADAAGAFISDGDHKKLVMIDYAEGEYFEITREQLQRLKARVEAAMATMKAQMVKLPPEQRKQMEKILDAQAGVSRAVAPPDEKYTRAPGSKTIAGYKCDLYTVEVDGQHVADTCLIPWSNLKIDRDQFKQSVEAIVDVSSNTGMGMGMGMDQKSPGPMLKAWGMTSGLPAWRKTVKADEDEVTETTLKGIAQGAIPRSTFEPPAGFKKKTVGKLDQE